MAEASDTVHAPSKQAEVENQQQTSLFPPRKKGGRDNCHTIVDLLYLFPNKPTDFTKRQFRVFLSGLLTILGSKNNVATGSTLATHARSLESKPTETRNYTN